MFPTALWPDSLQFLGKHVKNLLGRTALLHFDGFVDSMRLFFLLGSSYNRLYVENIRGVLQGDQLY